MGGDRSLSSLLRINSVILDSSVERSLFKSVPHFFFVLLMTSFPSSLYILKIKPLSVVGLVKMFSYSVH